MCVCLGGWGEEEVLGGGGELRLGGGGRKWNRLAATEVV